MILGLSGRGVIPLVLGDIKPDHVERIAALGGQVIKLNDSQGHLNVLDPGESVEAAKRLRESTFATPELAQEALALAEQIEADAITRRSQMVMALITIKRKSPPAEIEETLVEEALRLLDKTHREVPPVLGDLLKVIQEAPPELRDVALDRGDIEDYQNTTKNLERSLIGLTRTGAFGRTFAHQTVNPMRRDRPVVYDISAIPTSSNDLRAAALLACWSNGFASVNIAHALADVGLEPRRHYFIVMDELWQALRAGHGMVDRMDALTRLNRTYGVGQAMITHTMKDLLALPNKEDQEKALGYVERAGMVMLGALPRSEMKLLTESIPLSQREQDMLVSWSAPPAYNKNNNQKSKAPGLGKFLIKIGGRPGIPFDMKLTGIEAKLGDTNALWTEKSQIGSSDVEEGEIAS
ncbi:hypothetical protein CIK76_18890 [Glutamicibacter sp. BW80]|nr:hypothetical protein CIK76_18890 [Glutamicibacter sp. BW80]